MTQGQELALHQLRDVATFGGPDLEIVRVDESADRLSVDLSLRTGHLTRVEDGLPLRERERFTVHIPRDSPFVHPEVATRHSRFAGFPHVQFGRHLCLYQAPGTEWNPSDGLFGFLVRLEEWLVQGALNQLDPVGAPLHPPAIYPTHPLTVIPHVDTPAVGSDHWYGLAQLDVVSDRRLDLIGWVPAFGEAVQPPVAAALLLAAPMTWEFPRTVVELVTHLEARGISRQRVLLALQVAVIRNAADTPLYVVIGAPMRGVRGGATRQHLSVWFIEPVMATALRLSIEKYSSDDRLREIGAEVEAIIWRWAQEVKVSWCSVREDRPEIVTRRDHSSPLSVFRDKTIAMWGCGAIGSHIAEHVARAGARGLVLRDKASVAPGLLVRQQFDDAHIGDGKAAALADRLLRIRPSLEAQPLSGNLLETLAADQWSDGADIVIESTGAQAVWKKLELRWVAAPAGRTMVASLIVGRNAERGLAVVAGPEYSGGPLDVARRAKLTACANEALSHFREEFWPAAAQSRSRFQPEPGCSDPTFVGSSADVAVLAGAMINCVARDAASADSAAAHFISRADLDVGEGKRASAHFRWIAERTVRDLVHGFEVRISDAAWANILTVIEDSRQHKGPLVETGGLLLGERDEASRIVWITDATAPPPDSRATRRGFVCGTKGCRELDARRGAETLNAVRFVGMWHTHPGAHPNPSDIDLDGMAGLVNSISPPIAQALMVIVGHTPDDPTPAAYLFRRGDFPSLAPGDTPRSSWLPWIWMSRTLRALLSRQRRQRGPVTGDWP